MPQVRVLKNDMTQEQKKAAVLAECERLWKQRLDSEPNSTWDPETNPKNFIDELYPLCVVPNEHGGRVDGWEITVSYGQSMNFHSIWLSENLQPDHINWGIAYRLLNLGQSPEPLPSDAVTQEYKRLKLGLGDTSTWTAGENGTFFALFCHGWYGRVNEAAYQRENGPVESTTMDENGLLPTDEQIRFVASDESNHHDWMDLGFRNTYQQGFEDGAKWMRGHIPAQVKDPSFYKFIDDQRTLTEALDALNTEREMASELVVALEEMESVPQKIQDGIDLHHNEESYQLKTDLELVGKISEFGFGELEFHTADIQRLITQVGIAENILTKWREAHK